VCLDDEPPTLTSWIEGRRADYGSLDGRARRCRRGEWLLDLDAPAQAPVIAVDIKSVRGRPRPDRSPGSAMALPTRHSPVHRCVEASLVTVSNDVGAGTTTIAGPAPLGVAGESEGAGR
jgi:hypothetical protein